MRPVIMFAGLLHLTMFMQGQSPSVFREYDKTFTTYPFSDPDPIPSQAQIYPYFRYDGFTNKPVQKKWKVVELENDFIRVMILPEIGGKIWTAVEKNSGQPYIYYNQVVKFRDVAMRGPWTSGGLEPNYGIIGHTPNCATPVDYIVRSNPDKSVSCFITVLDLLTRTRWQMEVNVPHDKAYFTTRSFWNNPTSLGQPYYHWMNTGIKVKGNLEFIYPGTHYIGHNGEYADWPVNRSNNRQINFYEQNDFGSYKSYHVFGKYTDFFGAYWHDDQLGMVRFAPYEEKAGKKIWIWGLSRQGMIWEKILTDNDGQYAEVQSGRLFNQNAEQSTYTPFKHIGFSPQATDQWKEYWYPVRNTRGMKAANAFASVNVIVENGWLKWFCSPVQSFSDSMIIHVDGNRVYAGGIKAYPLQLIKDSVILTNTGNYKIEMPGIHLEWESDPAYQTLKRPVQTPVTFDWNSAYGLYIQAEELMDQKFFARAKEKLLACIKKDPDYLPGLVKLAELYYRDGRFSDAFELAQKALSIDTHDGAANYYYGIAAMQLADYTDALDGLSIASLSPGYRSAAYTEICKIHMLRKNWESALLYADKAISFNKNAVTAQELKAVTLRKQKMRDAALEVLNGLEAEQPLSPFVKMEKALWGLTQALTPDAFHRSELPEEVWLELAASYLACGSLEEAMECLKLAGDQAIPLYWSAYLQYRSGKSFQGLLEKANAASSLQVFPFRTELLPVFRWAVSTGVEWKPRYYLALLLNDKNQKDSARGLLNALGDTPDFAPLYAVRSLWRNDEDPGAVTDLQRAMALEPGAWRYPKLLAQFYIRNGDHAEALRITEKYVQQYPGNYIMDMLYAKSMLLNKRYKECDALLSRMDIIPFEGATEGRILYWEAKLMQAMEQAERKNYKQALRFVEAASLWPENLGVGKPYEADIDSRLENWLRYHLNSSMGNKEASQSALQDILDFKPGIQNTLMNFQSANHLLTAKAMEQRSGRKAALAWLDEQIRQYPDLPLIQWAKEVYVNGSFSGKIPEDAGARVIIRSEKLFK